MIKRVIDITLSAIGLIVLSPALAGIAAAIACGSPGPVIYRGRRTGLHGEPFDILKFRTMVVNAEQIGGSTTGEHDPRVTRVGSFLRRYKLDELPQLLNVLRGEMSLVGPRPEVAEYTDRYSPEERRILSVRPGITDWASLRFRDLQAVVGSEDPDRIFRQVVLPEKISLRLKYVDEQSLINDLRILLMTLAAVLSVPLRRPE